MENRSGFLSVRDPQSIRANVLPGASVSIHDRGIYYKGLYYAPLELINKSEEDPQLAEYENWFLRKTGRARPSLDTCFDPRDVAVFYIRLDDGDTIAPCGLLRGFKHLSGLTHDEYDDLKAIRAANNLRHFSEVVTNEHQYDQAVMDIVKDAQKQTAGIPVDTSQIRQARKEESLEVRRENAWRAIPLESPNSTETMSEKAEEVGGYKPAPNNLALLTNARKANNE